MLSTLVQTPFFRSYVSPLLNFSTLPVNLSLRKSGEKRIKFSDPPLFWDLLENLKHISEVLTSLTFENVNITNVFI